MAKLVSFAKGNDAMYNIWSVNGLELVLRHPKPNADLLIIPKLRVLRSFLL